MPAHFRKHLFLLIAFLSASLRAADAPRTRTVSLKYTATVKEVPAGTRQLDFWLPVPHSDAYQQITRLQVDSAYPYEISTDPLGNHILHIRLQPPRHRDLRITLRLDATRREHRRHVMGASTARREVTAAEIDRWLKPDHLVPLDGQIRSWAKEVVTAAHASTDLEKARAIYNHVVSTMKYDKTGKGWGRGDIYYACQTRRGNCTDFHAVFIGYARAVGIPARFAIGFPLPAERGSGQIAGYHCWVECYIKGIGWVPIDASEAAKDPSRRDYFFGTHDENRIEFTRGRDLILKPSQRGEPLNYFIYPYAEADGKPVPGVEQAVFYRDAPPRGLSSAGGAN